MIKLSFRLLTKRTSWIIGTLVLMANIAQANTRAEEIKQMMWNTSDADFQVTSIPDKWKNKSAVIIAQSNHMEYRKELIVANLSLNSYRHERIMLLDKKAVEEYSQMSFPEDGSYGGINYMFYVGYKIIKPDGKEIEVPINTAVKEERAINNRGYNQKKLAIPNLEVGDILDFYYAEDQIIRLTSTYYSFDPVIFQLNREYPIMKRKVSFDVLRRCFINIKALNGAPSFKLSEDTKKEKNSYFLEIGDLESVKDIKWLYDYRALPTVKFKVTYATTSSARLPTFIGSPGVMKSSVSQQEVASFVEFRHKTNTLEATYFKKYMKKHFKNEKNKDKLAREAFYALRNRTYISSVEGLTVSGNNPHPYISNYKQAATLSAYLRDMKIPHEFIVGIPRQISSIDDLILENELSFMLKINTPKPFYIGMFNNHALPGEIDEDLQGTKAYSINGLQTTNFTLKKIDIPVISHEHNTTKSLTKCVIDDLNDDKVTLEISKEISGRNKLYYQFNLMDIYDYFHEEKDKYEMKADFENFGKTDRARLLKQKADYMSNREKELSETLKSISESNYNFTIDEVDGLKIHQTGRHHEHPEFKFSYNLKASGIIKKAGPNYLLDVGKLIEIQTEINKDERDRDYDIYMPYARSFDYKIELEIPDGFEVQGIEKLNVSVENETGGFRSKSSMEGNKLVIDTYKYYKSNFESKENWGKMLEFLDVGYKFSEQNILIRKKMIN